MEMAKSASRSLIALGVKPVSKLTTLQAIVLDEGSLHLVAQKKNVIISKISSPISVIDEQLYAAPPTLLLSTVDNFALLPWDDGPPAFLGRGTGKPPSLIIQDELQLISGPLGSVVGHCENLIHSVMEKYGDAPKIVASTATIRRAKEQSSWPFRKRRWRAFPPQASDYDDLLLAVDGQGNRIHLKMTGQLRKDVVIGEELSQAL